MVLKDFLIYGGSILGLSTSVAITLPYYLHSEHKDWEEVIEDWEKKTLDLIAKIRVQISSFSDKENLKKLQDKFLEELKSSINKHLNLGSEGLNEKIKEHKEELKKEMKNNSTQTIDEVYKSIRESAVLIHELKNEIEKISKNLAILQEKIDEDDESLKKLNDLYNETYVAANKEMLEENPQNLKRRVSEEQKKRLQELEDKHWELRGEITNWLRLNVTMERLLSLLNFLENVYVNSPKIK